MVTHAWHRTSPCEIYVLTLCVCDSIVIVIEIVMQKSTNKLCVLLFGFRQNSINFEFSFVQWLERKNNYGFDHIIISNWFVFYYYIFCLEINLKAKPIVVIFVAVKFILILLMRWESLVDAIPMWSSINDACARAFFFFRLFNSLELIVRARFSFS